MFSFFQVPVEVADSHIFSNLELEGLLPLALVSRDMRTYSRHRREKAIILHLFEKAVPCFDPYTKNETLKKLSAHYFSQIKLRIDALGKIGDTDIIWVNGLLGYMYLGGYGVERDVAKGIGYLTDAARLGNTKAMLMLAFIFLKDVFDIRRVPGEIRSLRKMYRVRDAFESLDLSSNDIEQG